MFIRQYGWIDRENSSFCRLKVPDIIHAAIFAPLLMGTLIIIAQFILALAILVTLHELGHFIAARAFGIKVEKFYLFFDAFGFKLFKFKKGDTEYGIGWLPLGGYVKIAGMIDESLDTNQLKSEPQPWEFRAKPAWQRLIVMIGGVTVNMILGLGIFISLAWMLGNSYVPNEAINSSGGIYASPDARKFGFRTGDHVLKLNGKPVNDLMGEFLKSDFSLASKKEVLIHRNGKDTTLVLNVNLEEYLGKKGEIPFIGIPYTFKLGDVSLGSPAAKAGLKKGDMIAEINGKDCHVFFVFKEIMAESKGKEIVATIVTEKNGTKTAHVKIGEDGTMGFMPELMGFENSVVHEKYGFGTGIVAGTNQSFEMLGANIKALGKVVSGKVDARKSVAGPIGIAQMFGTSWNWFNFWRLTGMLSLILAFMNILPIPALDGGHVMFLLWEMITRRPVNEKVLYVGQIIGMVILLALIVFVFWVDISKALGF